jgi:hypothetical protein
MNSIPLRTHISNSPPHVVLRCLLFSVHRSVPVRFGNSYQQHNCSRKAQSTLRAIIKLE